MIVDGEGGLVRLGSASVRWFAHLRTKLPAPLGQGQVNAWIRVRVSLGIGLGLELGLE